MLESIVQISELGKSSRDEKRTERYALKREEAFDRYYSEISEVYDEIISEIDKAIAEHDTRKYLSIINFSYADTQFLNEFLELKAIADICYEELQQGKEKTFLDCFDKRTELVRVFRELKFILYRLQFIPSEYEAEYLCDFISDNDISEYMVEYIIEHCVLDKLKVTLLLAKNFLNRGMASHASQTLKMSRGAVTNGGE